MSPTQVAGSLPQGNRDSWRMTSKPLSGNVSDAVADAGAPADGAAVGAADTTDTTSQPSPASSSPTTAARASWVVRTAAGTDRSRVRLRARASAGGVSNRTATHGIPAARPAARVA